jgi:hypothetical protein
MWERNALHLSEDLFIAKMCITFSYTSNQLLFWYFESLAFNVKLQFRLPMTVISLKCLLHYYASLLLFFERTL